MEAIKWIFSGIGVAVLTGIVGLVVRHKKAKCETTVNQSQKAGDNSQQQQIGVVINNKKGE